MRAADYGPAPAPRQAPAPAPEAPPIPTGTMRAGDRPAPLNQRIGGINDPVMLAGIIVLVALFLLFGGARLFRGALA